MADRLSESDGRIEFLSSSHSDAESDGELVTTRPAKRRSRGGRNTERV